MTIDYIREFVVLAEIENFMEAADRLSISQSSLTRHIKSIENDLGTQLFDRTTRKVTLNHFGRLFLRYAKEISRIHYECETAFYNELQGVHGNVRVGSIPIMIPYKITNVLARFQRENAAFFLDVVEADSLELIKMLRSGQCDFAFIRQSDDSDNEFNKLPYASDTLVALVPESHFLAKKEVIQISQLNHESLLLLAKDTFMYSLCVGECRKAGFEPHVTFSGHRADNILDLVSEGMGIALLMKKASSSLIKPGIAVINIEPPIRSVISLAYPKHVTMSEPAKHFLNLVKTFEI
ncbi:MAG: LysR family transcriptional regulator [Clostridiaceae bacterium]|jgi:DNA-binding transcriptional LysR family regulator|nr:LysR family transcriptional regulator [Clostridiaceae bacterium]